MLDSGRYAKQDQKYEEELKRVNLLPGSQVAKKLLKEAKYPAHEGKLYVLQLFRLAVNKEWVNQLNERLQEKLENTLSFLEYTSPAKSEELFDLKSEGWNNLLYQNREEFLDEIVNSVI